MPRDRDEDEFEDELADGAAVEGDATARKRLLPWLRGLVEKNTESEEAEFPVVLCQTAHGTDKLLKKEVFEIGADDLDEFLDMMLDAAVADASHYTGTTRYALKVAINGREKHQKFSLANLATGPKGDGSRDLREELNDPRTLSGHVGQMMRHEEAYADKIIHLATSNQDTLERQLKAAHDRIRELEQRERDVIPLLAQVHDMSWKKDFEIEKFRQEQEQKKQVTGMLLQTLPHLASGVLGGGFAAGLMGAGGAPGPDGGVVTGSVPQPPEYPILLRLAMHVEGLLSSLAASADKQRGIGQFLEPLDMMTLSEIHSAVEQLRALRGGAAASPPAATPPAPPQPQNGAAPPSPNASGGFVPFGQKSNAGA